ncbi:MAG: hypothetical protein Q8S13_11860, partial [Dehalococcoidia bacterium]|nr:hypothetical protein [Dehalococcoidia bacterium]
MTLCRFSRLIAIGGVLAFLLVASVGQEPPPAEAAFTDSDADGAIDIAEEITSSDPNNPDSTPETRDYAFFTFQPLCLDGEDNDLDGLVDTDDEGCVDTDGDVISDPVETALASDPLDGMSFPEDSRLDLILEFEQFIIGFFCGDGADNDLDGLTDAADPGCDPVASDADGFDDATE